MPFQRNGLWLAVIWISPAAPRMRTSKESAGVGHALEASETGLPAAEMVSAATCANFSEPKRVSNPTSTSAPGFSARTVYRAIASVTVRTFSYVKSSAITPRQPSVPNLISVTAQSISDAFSAGKEVLSSRPENTSQNGRTLLVVNFTAIVLVFAPQATLQFFQRPE